MISLSERLRELVNDTYHQHPWCGQCGRDKPQILEAADLIDKLHGNKQRLVKALRDITANAPKNEPEWYSGDNHGDTRVNAADMEHWRVANIARAALAAVGEGEA